MALPEAVSGNTFNAANQMTAFGAQALTYDANGNLTADGTNTYTWSARNQLESIGGETSSSFQYDGFDRRTHKVLSGQTTRFLYDDRNPVQELSGPGIPSANVLTGLALDEHLGRTDSAGSRWFLRDILGSIVALTDATGAIRTTYAYEPYGRSSEGGDPSSNSYQFAGRELDTNSIYALRWRYYHAGFSRFLSPDPVFATVESDSYAYAHGQPTLLVDPLGLRYGTGDCSFYAEACRQVPGEYNCFYVPLACESFPKGWPWWDCVRKCLQDLHRRYIPPPDVCGPPAPIPPFDWWLNHEFCYRRCWSNPEDPFRAGSGGRRSQR